METPQFKVTRKTPLNSIKKKVIVVCDSITKFCVVMNCQLANAQLPL